MDVRTYGDSGLKRKSASVREVSDEIRKTAFALIDTMRADDGVGLAAPQVGLNIRMVAIGCAAIKKDAGMMLLSPGERELLPRMPLVLINPRIISYSDVKDVSEEGCLSVPDIYAPVERPVSIVLEAGIIDGELVRAECGGFLARVLQHEIDHLEGILFIDRLEPEILSDIKPKLETLKKLGHKKGFVKKAGGSLL
ncbi:MAG: peptide deformylase [Lentisphaerae bacterium GWF2_45_14]|nr:MAG: peptide deformylase [Lentisphaerae bacterium GWF2_45_14]